MVMSKMNVAILGPGNIGTDLMYKVLRQPNLHLKIMSGVVATSEGLARAKALGIKTSIDGLDGILNEPGIDLVFDATGAKYHKQHAPILAQKGIIAIDLTPAAVGPFMVPAVNLDEHLDSKNFNMVTCGGQATVPIVAAINRAGGIEYAEIVATISSKSAGPGTRQNIDEFTETTAKAVEIVGGAKEGKAIIILNPAEPPILMRNTIYARVRKPNRELIERSVLEMVKRVQSYVPGYRLKVGPLLDGDKVTVMVEVQGSGDYLPEYSGNLDIITAASAGLAEMLAVKGRRRKVG